MTINLVPKYVFFTQGSGCHSKKLVSFEYALREAGISQFNLVQVSSILPPKCIIISKEEGLQKLTGKAGSILFVVLSRMATNKIIEISASIGSSRVKNDPDAYGYISEYHASGLTKEETGVMACDLAAEMLAGTLKVPFNMNDDNYNAERDVWYLKDGKVLQTNEITSYGFGSYDEWTTVIAAAVFIME